jgi:TolA-binding protein
VEKTIKLPSENCLSDAQLLRYLKDECSQQEQRGIDKHLDKCAFCSDAVQGAINLPILEFENSMNRESILQAFTKKTLWLAKPSAKVWIGLTTAASIAAIVFVTNNFWNNNSTVAAPSVATTPTIDNNQSQTPIAANDAIPVTDAAKAKVTETTQKTGNSSTTLGGELAATTTSVLNASGSTTISTYEVNKLEDAAAPSAPAMEKEGQSAMERAKDIPVVTVATAKKNMPETYPSPAQNSTQMSQNNNGYNYSDNDGVTDNDDSNSRSYNIGLQMYYAKKYKEAIVTLEKFQGERGTKAEKQKANWFLANAYLSVGNTPRAKQLLENIANGGGTYSEQAKKTLENNQ